MPAMTIRNLSVSTHKALKRRAVKRGTSAEAEVRAILDAAVKSEPEIGLGTLLQQLGRKYGPLPEIKTKQRAQ